VHLSWLKIERNFPTSIFFNNYALSFEIMEHIRTPKVDNVRLLDRFNARNPSIGTLYLTATHLIFIDPAGKKETWILHMHVSNVEKLPLTTSGSPLVIRCKTFLCVTFIIPRERDCHDIYTSLVKLSQPGELGDLYAFHYNSPDVPDRSTGWNMFDIQSEYLRMGVPNENWVQTSINKDYELCDTYPRCLYVPASASTPVLLGSARFRSRGRLPVLTYLHRDSQAAILRCSQPLAGFSARCVEDEAMLQCCLQSNPKTKFMYVVDTRPKINAMANKAAGKGFEDEKYYTNIKFEFKGIENIHVMRSSLGKLLEVCELKNPGMGAFLSGMESCGWMKHIKAVMDTSAFIAKAVLGGANVVVHCSDGWDRTAQVCALSQIMLDPYYRSLHGFQTLIEKEWLSFGHKFTDRCGFVNCGDGKETSPIFTQFLECVWHLSRFYPHSFQFNERFLHTLHEHVYSCQYGTFIGNCEKDRLDLRLRERTYSLWGFIKRTEADYLNPFYRRETELTHPTLIPHNAPQSFTFWRSMYMRHESCVHPRESVFDTLCALKDHSTSMEEHIRLLEKRISRMCGVLGKSDEEQRRILAGLANSESMDLTALLNGTHITSHQPEDHSPGLTRHESDTESGFEDAASSQLSKSTMDDSGSLSNSAFLAGSEEVSADTLLMELKSVAVNWKTLRNVRSCNCAIPFETFTKKYHCWRCGDVFCTRCIDRLMTLPGHFSQKQVPVCKNCYKQLKNSPSPSIQDFKVHSQT